VERIGLYQLHHVDPAVPPLDSVEALEERARKARSQHCAPAKAYLI
jgi:aryl-alcohol dehydrogenase-like predicted oxidoreductase